MSTHALAPRLIGTAFVLVAAPLASAQLPRVALCAAESSSTSCNFTDPQTRLMSTGRFAVVDIINVFLATPTLAQLQAYDAVMCWTNSTPVSSSAWGDVLADYVDSGGGVVVTVFANSTLTANRNILGRWQSGYEVIMDQSGNFSGAGGVLETIVVPGHPVVAGVTAFAGGTIGSRPTGTTLEVGAILLATWGGGKVLAAVGANPHRVDLGFFPTTCSASGYVTGGELLMANALEYAARGGLFGPFGAGCAGSLGVPTLAAAGTSRPVIGSTFNATLGNLPLSVGIVVVGFSNTTSGPFTLPLSLTQFGLTGCNLLAEVLVNQFVVGTGNTANWSVSLPNNPLFIGSVLYNQGFSLDPPANIAGLTVSNAGRVKVGD